ncbi:hypothetical protein GBA52_014947 [Prunus armeniaca]|nr:hypothetical protein GBA52_014947 [Prunus armeniaca]
MERIMEVMRVPQNHRVALTTFFLVRNARHWWESVKRRYRDPSAITWQLFRAAFDSQYYPLAYQNLKIQRLTNFGDLVMSASLIESSQMMVRARGEPRRRQFDMGGPGQGSSKRGSYSLGSSSGRSYGGFGLGASSSGGSNQSGSSGSRSRGSSTRGTGRKNRTQCA